MGQKIVKTHHCGLLVKAGTWPGQNPTMPILSRHHNHQKSVALAVLASAVLMQQQPQGQPPRTLLLEDLEAKMILLLEDG